MEELIDAGNSFSGREQNCAFLNLGDSTFATVSAVTGFDFPDDSRSLALTDWDGDGDLDVWMTNRNAPMVRFLRNDTPRKNGAFRLLLEGTRASRDALGARVEVRLKGQPEKPLVRTVQAGEGFLGQSSRWLHFGLGAGEIESVKVIWPGGKSETIDRAQANHACRFVEGDLFPEFAPLPAAAAPAPAAPLSPLPAAVEGLITLLTPAPFPPLPAVRPDGSAFTVEDTEGPLLINLWASWCPDCAEELAEWKLAAADFAKAGVKVMLLAADGMETQHGTGFADACRWAEKKEVPFPVAQLTPEAFRRVVYAHRLLFGQNIDLPVPTSFLLDGTGRVMAVYRGKVPAARVLSDAALAGKDLTTRALLFPGRWLQPPPEPDPSSVLTDLAKVGAWDDAMRYFRRQAAALERHKDFSGISAAFGSLLEAAGREADAASAYEAALRKSPDNPGALNNLAWLLATAKDPAIRSPARAVELATKAAKLSKRADPAYLDTLAAAHAAKGEWKQAVSIATEAQSLAKKQKNEALARSIAASLEAYRDRKLPAASDAK